MKGCFRVTGNMELTNDPIRLIEPAVSPGYLFCKFRIPLPVLHSFEMWHDFAGGVL
jgi:hypothetical protein